MPEDRPRPVDSVYHLYAQVRAAGGNLLLDVAPDTSGQIPDYTVEALMQFRERVKERQ